MDAGPEHERWLRVSQGDQEAWNEVVDAYDRLVWHVIMGFRLGAEDSADVHQTTWLRLAERVDHIREPQRIGSWLATTARRECQRVAAARARTTSVEIDLEAIPDDGSPDEHLLADEAAVTLWRAFSTLPPSCQQLLRLLLAEPPFTYEEIGAILDMPIGSIGPTRSRCLDRLARSPGVLKLRESR